jgi:hypothetical protein
LELDSGRPARLNRNSGYDELARAKGAAKRPLGLAMSKLPGFRRLLAPGLLLGLLVFSETSIADESGGKLAAPAGGGAHVFALVAGIDEYQYVPQLNGAVADAEDIARSLKNDGVTHVTTLLNAAVTRAAITKAMSDIVAQAQAGDLVILTFAGHGAQEDAKVVTKDNSGKDEVFILAGFDDDDASHLSERLLDKEIFSWLSHLDAKGVAVIFLADTCHSGGLSKTIDPRIGHVGVRALRTVKTRGESNPAAGVYYVGKDPLQAETAHLPEAPATDDLKRLTFLAAVDKWTESPEVLVPGIPTPRGAISYAFARALEGDADYDDEPGVHPARRKPSRRRSVHARRAGRHKDRDRRAHHRQERHLQPRGSCAGESDGQGQRVARRWQGWADQDRRHQRSDASQGKCGGLAFCVFACRYRRHSHGAGRGLGRC